MFQGMRYVYEVYNERSFSKAAAKLFISQPSLSANIRRVEQKIGYPLFDRSTKPVELTECGRHYIRAAEQILSAENEFINFINDWGDLKTGSLTLGGSSFFSSWVLPPLIGNFSRKYPHLDIHLIEENTTSLANLLQKGQLDFMLDNCELENENFDRCIYKEEHLVLAVPSSFSVNKNLTDFQISAEQIRNRSFLDNPIKPVPLTAFSSFPFVLLKPENDTGKRAREICRGSGLCPHIVLELDQQMTAYNITCSGAGISFCGDLLISLVPDVPGVIYYKLPPAGNHRSIYFYWKKGRYLSRAMEEFLKLVAHADNKSGES